MFVATSNSMNIPPALLDRMEVIRLSGYTEDEKTIIAMKYLLPKQLRNNSVKDEELQITEGCRARHGALLHREGGVRSLERLNCPRSAAKVVKALLLKKLEPQVVVGRQPSDFLGVRKYTFGQAEQRTRSARSLGWPGPRWVAIC